MKKIQVTEPFLPPFEEYVEEYLKGIWERNWLTNQGPLVQVFEQKLLSVLRFHTLLSHYSLVEPKV